MFIELRRTLGLPAPNTVQWVDDNTRKDTGSQAKVLGLDLIGYEETLTGVK